MMDKLTVGEFLVQSIKNAGIKSVFGIPGDIVIRFFKVIEDDPDLKLYTFSHEPGVGFAAVASARATRKPAVACVSARAEAGKHYSLLFKAGLGRASCIQKRTVEAFNGGTHEKRH